MSQNTFRCHDVTLRDLITCTDYGCRTKSSKSHGIHLQYKHLNPGRKKHHFELKLHFLRYLVPVGGSGAVRLLQSDRKY